MDDEEALSEYREHVGRFASRLKEAKAQLLLGDGELAKRATDRAGFRLDRRRLGEWMRGSQIPNSKEEVRVLEEILQLPEDDLFSEWKQAAVAKARLGRRRAPANQDATERGDESLHRSANDSSGSSTGSPTDAVQRRLDALMRRLETALLVLPDRWADTVASFLIEPFLDNSVDPFLADVEQAQVGNIRLSVDQYYEMILEEMQQAGQGWRIVAVSTLSSNLWIGEPDQLQYVEFNCRAAAQGAKIERIFIIPSGSDEDFRSVIERQANAGIKVRVGHPRILSQVTDLEDFVAFSDPVGRRGYVSRPAIDGSKRVLSGTMILSEHRLGAIEAAFRKAWKLLEPTRPHPPKVGAVDAKPKHPEAPGNRLAVRTLAKQVVTCEEAANARGIPLSQELKTLVVWTSTGLVAVHLRGDKRVDLRKVKSQLEADQARLADPEDLATIGLSPGTVSAVLEPVWSMRHLVSRTVLRIEQVMTNNGTKTGYFAFDPTVLLDALDVQIGDFDA